MSILYKPVYKEPVKTGDETLDLAAQIKATRLYEKEMAVYEVEYARREKLKQQGVYVKSLRRG